MNLHKWQDVLTLLINYEIIRILNSRIAKASAVMSKLHKRVWSNNNLTVNTKMRVYRACVLSTLLYSSETWTTYAAQEKRLNSFHQRCLRRILSIRWQDKIPNTVVLERAGLPSIFMLLSQRRLRWLGHVRRMADGRIPKDLLYGELSRGARSRGRPRLRFKDTCKRDLKSASIDIQSWESLAESRDSWRAAVHCGDQASRARPHRPPKGEESRPQKILLHRPGSNIPHLPPVRQRLSLPHRPTQSYEEVQRPELTQPDAAIVSRDGRRPTTTKFSTIL